MKRALRIPGMFLSALVELCVTNIPGALGRELRYLYWSVRVKAMGSGVKIDVGVKILNPEWVTIGDNTWIDNYVILLAGPAKEGDGPLYRKFNPDFDYQEGEIVVGSNVHIANFVVVQGHGGVVIGDNVGVASGSMIYSMSHHHSNLIDRSDNGAYRFTPMVPRSEQSLICAPVVMSNNTALGLNSILLPGVTIGTGSWVGSASMVARSIGSNVLVAGNPAQSVKDPLHADPVRDRTDD